MLWPRSVRLIARYKTVGVVSVPCRHELPTGLKDTSLDLVLFPWETGERITIVIVVHLPYAV